MVPFAIVITGSSSRGRSGFMYTPRAYGSHREFTVGTGSNSYQHGGSGTRRASGNQGDAHRDGYRDKTSDPATTYNRPRGNRQNRPNNFNYGKLRFLLIIRENHYGAGVPQYYQMLLCGTI